MGGEITSLSATCQHVSSGCVVEEGIQTVGFSISAKMVALALLSLCFSGMLAEFFLFQFKWDRGTYGDG